MAPPVPTEQKENKFGFKTSKNLQHLICLSFHKTGPEKPQQQNKNPKTIAPGKGGSKTENDTTFSTSRPPTFVTGLQVPSPKMI